MNTYTAKQVAEVLQREDPQMNLRTVRYYTQIGMLPPLALAGNKRVYTDNHLHYLRAILVLSKSGETLASAQEKLAGLPLDDVIKLGDNLRLYQSDQMLHSELHVISEEVILSVSPRISPSLKEKMIAAVTRLLQEEEQE
ncbi:MULTISPECIES: MerR family transcriptional regulator [unclassified Paenibacillus]|uniref:MerR family transcriptional regulator n=1 Tax=unclassified Paenibacillus TaxID=185978 RepID=UPI0003E2390C|nr:MULTISPECIES: MerR family transcriptional regulator [unclassified Paenibacillus]ETT48476.1 MerR family transcriptional regulator [Paenibacillus sp. FSL R7-269]OMF99258.1 MerR family transcriptional regulator [Paenibacillus sp. FSL R7-0337]